MNSESTFYNKEYDCELLKFAEVKKYNCSDDDYRNCFQLDRDHILFSSSFRRLQGKTQIYPIGEYDFYRTRLTHSIEVAKIGRSICNALNKKAKDKKLFKGNEYIDPVLVEAAGLAHDIGHPPFGHTGEEALNEIMQDFGGFEGNAQSLRIITHLIHESSKGGGKGMEATRAFLDSILKYKTIFKKGEKKFLYEDQKEILDKVLKDSGPKDSKSIECQIMDWADDTAYSIHDMSDGIKAGFIRYRNVMEWIEEEKKKIKKECYGAKSIELDRMRKQNGKIIKEMIDDRESYFEDEVGRFIDACSLKVKSEVKSEKTKRYSYELVPEDKAEARCQIYKAIAKDLVYEDTKIKQVRYKFETTVKELFNAFRDNPKKLLPEKIYEKIKNENDEVVARSISDYISGMTDSFAIHMYKRLHDASYGSFRDIV